MTIYADLFLAYNRLTSVTAKLKLCVCIWLMNLMSFYRPKQVHGLPVLNFKISFEFEAIEAHLTFFVVLPRVKLIWNLIFEEWIHCIDFEMK